MMNRHIVQEKACVLFWVSEAMLAFQVVMALVTLIAYCWHYLSDYTSWLRSSSSSVEAKGQQDHSSSSAEAKGQQGHKLKGEHAAKTLTEDSDLRLCFNFSIQV